MKNHLLLVFMALSLTSFAQTWQSDFNQAKILAQKENKNILLVFAGSDWCAPCIKLERYIWESEEFKNESKKWVLYKADFPKKKENQLSAELTETNKKLAAKYNKEGNFPLVVVLDKNGKVLGMKGFEKISPNDYFQALNSFIK